MALEDVLEDPELAEDDEEESVLLVPDPEVEDVSVEFAAPVDPEEASVLVAFEAGDASVLPVVVEDASVPLAVVLDPEPLAAVVEEESVPVEVAVELLSALEDALELELELAELLALLVDSVSRVKFARAFREVDQADPDAVPP